VPAVLTFAFDPVVHLAAGLSVRLETLGIAVALFAGIVLAGIGARRAGGSASSLGRLEPVDLVYMLVGSVPGAVLGGRLGYVLDHLEFYQANPSAILDVSQGSFGLTLGVPLGIATGAVVGWLIGAPVGRWLRVAAVPLLVALALAKLAEVLGATGQGQPSQVGWATAYAGPGPWGSLAPDVPSLPSQAVEGFATLAVAALVLGLRWIGPVARRGGAIMLVGLGLWAVARLGVAFTWRDPIDLGPLRSDQALSLVVIALSVGALVSSLRSSAATPDPDAEPRAEPIGEPMGGPAAQAAAPVGEPTAAPTAEPTDQPFLEPR